MSEYSLEVSESPKSKNRKGGGKWLAQSVEHATLDLGVVSSSPMVGVEPTFKK